MVTLLNLKGVTLIYGPPGAGKTTFTAWYTSQRYRKIFWVSVFEDEASFRNNVRALNIDFGDRLTYWEAPMADLRSFFATLVDATFKEKPEALVIDSATEILAMGGGLELIHNVVYRAVKQAGIDVYMTAEEKVASRLAYIADNVFEIKYEVRPYGSRRELVVRKIRGGKAGYVIPLLIIEGFGVAPLLGPIGEPKVEVLATGTCIDEAAGGLYKGALHALVGAVGAGKTTLMVKTARNIEERGGHATLVELSGGATLQAKRLGVKTIEVGLNLENLLTALYYLSGMDAVFIRGIDAFGALYGREAFYYLLYLLHLIARGGPAIVVSTRRLAFDYIYDVVLKMEEGSLTAVRAPGGKIGAKVKCI